MFIEGIFAGIYLSVGLIMTWYVMETEDISTWGVWILWVIFPFMLPLYGLLYLFIEVKTEFFRWAYAKSWWIRYWTEMLKYEKNLGRINNMNPRTLRNFKPFIDKFPADNWYKQKCYDRVLERLKGD